MKTSRKVFVLLLALLMLMSLLPATALAVGNDAVRAVVSNQTIRANGKEIRADVYNIDGYNYFKLRDIAALMNGTCSQFSVNFDAEVLSVSVETGKGYEAVGGELQTGKDNSSTCVESAWSVEVNGVKSNVSVYNIGGNNYFKLRDLGVALGLKVDYDEKTRTASVDEGGYSLIFDKDAYTKHEETLPDGTTVKYRTYEKVVYESNPALLEKNVLTIYVPEEYFNGGSVGQYTAETAPLFLKNGIGGYMEASISGLVSTKRDGSTSISTEGEMLKHGLVIVSAAARGHNSVNADGEHIGIAPASIIDLKAVVRYLKYNDAVIPGNSERIISDGGSAGGAISALLGTSGNDPVYDEALKAVGAADAGDDIYAAFVFCPILDLENLNEAYEWFYMGTGLDWYAGKSTWSKNDENHVEFYDVEKILSPIFAEKYIDYINSKKLVSPFDGKALKLDADGNGSYRDLVKSILIASAQEEMDKKGELAATQYDGIPECFTVKDGKVLDVNLDAYLCCIQRLGGVGSMDCGYLPKIQYGKDLGLVQTNEAKVFAINGYENLVHFDPNLYPSLVKAIEQGADFSFVDSYFEKGFNVEDFKVTEGLESTNPSSPVYQFNPLNFVGDADSDTAPNFFVCAGACDNDVSMITATLLGTALYTSGDVDKDSLVLKYQWDKKHGGDYDIPEMCTWIDSICDPIRFDASAGESRKLDFDGKTVSYAAYENLIYVRNPADSRYQTLNLYVPDGANEKTPMILQNNSGGYNSSAAGNDTKETARAFLAKGYVVASIGLRGQNAKMDNGDGTTTFTGRAPASVADLKAAIRYLRWNDERIAGDADRMILAGTSSGGGTTAIVGVTTDSPEYEPYLKQIGAADVSDALFACVCYCPVFNVDTSDLAYAWQVQDMTTSLDNATAEVRSFINGNKLGLFHNARNGFTVDENGVYTLNERELALTAYFAEEFPAYMNDVLKEIGLADLSINADGRTGSFVDFLRDTVSEEYNRYMTQNWSAEVIKAFINGTGYAESFALKEANADKGTFDVDRSAWLSYDEVSGTVSVTDLWAFFDYVGLLKSAPAFDGKRETNVYGETVVANDVTGTAFDPWLAKYDGTEVSDAVLQQEHLYSVFDFLCDEETPNVPNWFIRYGTIDNGVHAYPALLAASLKAQGENVDYRMAFERTHSGFYEMDELFAWLDDILSKA